MLYEYVGYTTDFLTLILVIATIVYVYLTSKLLKQARTDQKISFIQRQLELFYNPLLQELHRIFLYLDDAFIAADEYEGHPTYPLKIRNKKYNDFIYTPNQFISIKENLERMMKYRYLGTVSINLKLSDFLPELINHVNEFSEYYTNESHAAENRISNTCNTLEKEVEAEIKKLEITLYNMVK